MMQTIFFYNSECWTVRKKYEKSIHASDGYCWILWIAEVARLQKIRNNDIRQALQCR